MVLRRIGGGEVMEIVLDLGPSAHGEAQRVKQRFDAPMVCGDQVNAADASAASGERDVERLRGKLSFKLRFGELVAAAAKRRLELGLGLVDARSGGRPRRGGELSQRLERLGQLTGLAEILRLGVFERCRIGAGRELGEGRRDDVLDLVHGRRS